MTTNGTSARQKAERRGRRSEWLASIWLRAKGYRPIARRHRTPFGEIDLICERGTLVVFVEVKARRDTRSGLEAISPAAQKRLTHAAAHWLATSGWSGDTRFDVVIHEPGLRLTHLRNAWRPDFAPSGL